MKRVLIVLLAVLLLAGCGGIVVSPEFMARIDGMAKLQESVAAEAKAGSRKRQSTVRENESAEGLSDDLAATGIGRELDHRVRRIRFETESRPSAMINVRYEYRDALVRLGVLPPPPDCLEDPLARRERSRGFEEPEFAPDPYPR